MNDGPPLLEAVELERVYIDRAGAELRILDRANIAVRAGEAVAVVGASGTGKSTLLHLLGALDRPTGGQVRLDGRDLESLSRDARARLRNRKVGFVFQFHYLLGDFSALENAMMPALIGGKGPDVKGRAEALLRECGLGSRLEHVPGELSGGEQQRVAIARALMNSPRVVLADEPTGNLDARTSRDVADLLFRMRTEHGVAMVIVTHNRKLAERAERILELRDGKLFEMDRRDARM